MSDKTDKSQAVLLAKISGVVTVAVAIIVAWGSHIGASNLAANQLSMSHEARIVEVMRDRLEYQRDVFARYLAVLEPVKTNIVQNGTAGTKNADELEHFQSLIYLNADPYTVAATQRMYGEIYMLEKTARAGEITAEANNKFVRARQNLLDEMKKELRRREAAAAGVPTEDWSERIWANNGISARQDIKE